MAPPVPLRLPTTKHVSIFLNPDYPEETYTCPEGHIWQLERPDDQTIIIRAVPQEVIEEPPPPDPESPQENS